MGFSDPNLTHRSRTKKTSLSDWLTSLEPIKSLVNSACSPNALLQLQPAGPSEASFWNGAPKAVVEKNVNCKQLLDGNSSSYNLRVPFFQFPQS